MDQNRSSLGVNRHSTRGCRINGYDPPKTSVGLAIRWMGLNINGGIMEEIKRSPSYLV
jgi:hypothetical protein